MQERTITYQLCLNTMQYHYLCHEIQRTRQIYRWFCRIIQDNLQQKKTGQQGMPLSEKQLHTALHTYCKKYAPMLLTMEIKALEKDLLHYQNNCILQSCSQAWEYYRCKNITIDFYWRAMKLPLQLEDACYWQLEPIVFHWEIKESTIWYHKQKVFLKLHFQTAC